MGVDFYTNRRIILYSPKKEAPSNVEGSDSIVAGRLPQERTCCKNIRCGSYTRIIALFIAKYIDETKKNSRANEQYYVFWTAYHEYFAAHVPVHAKAFIPSLDNLPRAPLSS